MDLETRIAQYMKLTADDPTNEMAFFSLGNAYLQGERHLEAAQAFAKCAEINNAMTKAYQLAGRAYIDAGKKDDAEGVLLKGYTEAAARGDRMPKDAIALMLKEIDIEVPEIAEKEPPKAKPAGDFKCSKSGLMGTKLARPPFRNGMGQWIQDSISKETFNEWISLGTKVINELRLDLSNDMHDAVYDYAMRVFLGLDDATYSSVMDGQTPPMPDGQFKGVVDEMMSHAGHLESFQGKMHERVE
ncbi:MAG: Fe(2+)-trafficking protein [Phycisphaerales bacterium]|nr:Fe(2+)-trafficking protein [Phycisphaerales bacterium]